MKFENYTRNLHFVILLCHVIGNVMDVTDKWHRK